MPYIKTVTIWPVLFSGSLFLQRKNKKMKETGEKMEEKQQLPTPQTTNKQTKENTLSQYQLEWLKQSTSYIYLNNNCWNKTFWIVHFKKCCIFYTICMTFLWCSSVIFWAFSLEEERNLNYKFQMPDPDFKLSCIQKHSELKVLFWPISHNK